MCFFPLRLVDTLKPLNNKTANQIITKNERMDIIISLICNENEIVFISPFTIFGFNYFACFEHFIIDIHQ